MKTKEISFTLPFVAAGYELLFFRPGKAIRLDPGLAKAHNNLGIAHLAKGQLDEAVREYREAIRLVPGDADAHNNLGNAYKARGQANEAVREYREAIRLAHGLAEAHRNLGAILANEGQAAEAVEEYRQALELRPLPETVLQFAAALEAAGRRDEAIAEYQRFLDEAGQKYPDHAAIVKDSFDAASSVSGGRPPLSAAVVRWRGAQPNSSECEPRRTSWSLTSSGLE